MKPPQTLDDLRQQRARQRLQENVRQAWLHGTTDDRRQLDTIVKQAAAGRLAITEAHAQVTAIRNQRPDTLAA